jgi:hypothetical protein
LAGRLARTSAVKSEPRRVRANRAIAIFEGRHDAPAFRSEGTWAGWAAALPKKAAGGPRTSEGSRSNAQANCLANSAQLTVPSLPDDEAALAVDQQFERGVHKVGDVGGNDQVIGGLQPVARR